jgi:phage terminase small subunit
MNDNDLARDEELDELVPLSRDEAQRRWLESLEPPAELSDTAKEKWLDILRRYKDWTAGDLDLLTLYVAEWTRWQHAETQISAIGEVVKSPSG